MNQREMRRSFITFWVFTAVMGVANYTVFLLTGWYTPARFAVSFSVLVLGVAAFDLVRFLRARRHSRQ